MNVASGVFLLTDLIYHAVLGMVRYFLGRPFPFAFCAHVFPPAFTSGFVGAGIEQTDTSHDGK